MTAKRPLDYAAPPKPELRNWRKTFSSPLLFVAAIFGFLTLIWPNHRELWALAGAFALTGVIARYAS